MSNTEKILPKLTRTSVQVRYTTTDGVSATESFKNVKGDPTAGMLNAIEEQMRLLALFGGPRAVNEAKARINEIVGKIQHFKTTEGWTHENGL